MQSPRRIVAISDLHEKWNELTNRIPTCDILVVAGDLTKGGDLAKVQEFNNWCFGLMDSDKVKDVVCIAGNHDKTAATDNESFRYFLPDVTYLQDEGCEIQGLNIYGSPWTPSFFRNSWVFNADRGAEIRQYWEKIPENLDILITHGPPMGTCDYLKNNFEPKGAHVGCYDLRTAIEAKKPRVHICGHLHACYGIGILGSTMVINAASCNEHYQPINPPVLFTM